MGKIKLTKLCLMTNDRELTGSIVLPLGPRSREGLLYEELLLLSSCSGLVLVGHLPDAANRAAFPFSQCELPVSAWLG